MKKAFLLYHDYFELFNRLTPEECGKVLLALFKHVRGEKTPTFEGAADMLYTMVSAQVDRDSKRYKETCKQRATAGKLGGIASGKARKTSHEANEANEADIDIKIKKEKEIEIKRKRDTERASASASAAKGRASADPTEERAARERFYCIRRQKAEDAAERIHQKAMLDEEFAEAEREIRRTEPALARAEVQGGDVSALNKLLSAARKRRTHAMLRLHLTESDLKPKYACKKCSDTGFLPDGHPCDCYPDDG